MKILFIDTETGGIDSKKSALIQMSGIIRVDKKNVEEFNFFIKPFVGSEVTQEALNVQGRTFLDLEDEKYEEEEIVYKKFQDILNKYVDKFDKEDKFVVAGYNVKFDINFLEEFFKRNNDKYLFSYIKRRNLDPIDYIPFLQMCNLLPELPNNKLGTWCEYFNIPLDAHDSLNDIRATKDLIFETVKLLKK